MGCCVATGIAFFLLVRQFVLWIGVTFGEHFIQITSPLHKHCAWPFPQTRNKMGQRNHPRKEVILVQVHGHNYTSEESTHLCIKKLDASYSKVIIFLLHAHVRGKHCTAAQPNTTDAPEPQWQWLKDRPCVGSTQTQSIITTSSPQNLHRSQEGNMALKPVFNMPVSHQEGGVLSKRP